jgi:amino acid adenylation domain-containing protein
MLSNVNLSERISKLSPEKRALFEKKLRGEFTTEIKVIPERSEEDTIPLSFAQERLWFLYQLEPGSFAYNSSVVLHITGKLDINSLEESVNEILKRHEILRTVYPSYNGVAHQVILSHKHLSLSIIDTEKSDLQALIKKEFQQSFNLETGPVVIPALFRMSEEEHLLILTIHHIAFDGWSRTILLNELTEIYQSCVSRKPLSMKNLPVQYSDFSIRQREWLSGERLKKQVDYWKEKLRNYVPLELPLDHPRQPVQTYNGKRQSMMIPKSLSDKLKELSRQKEVTLFMALLACFKILLYRYTGQEDISAGTPVANRNQTEMEGLIGFFVNSLVLRTDLSGNPSFLELLKRVREVTLEALAHQDLPFEKLVEELKPQRDMSLTPFFQVMFQLRNFPKKILELPDLKIEELEFDPSIAKFDLSIDIEEKSEGLLCLFEYNTDLFEDGTISRMAGHFQTLLQGIAANPDKKLSKLPILTDAEKHKLLVEWNNTQREYPKNQCIHQLFEEQVEKTPDNIALVYKDKKLTYRELNEKANQLARVLREKGVKPDVIVAIMVHSSLEMIIGLLGILKAGGACLPVDPDFPEDRIKFMLEDSNATLLLSQQSLADNKWPVKEVIILDSDNLYRGDTSNPGNINTSNNLAYIMYTSGSTGKPKGVMIEHRSAVNFFEGFADRIDFSSDKTILLITTMSFDPFFVETLLPLIKGLRIIITSEEEKKNTDLLNQLLIKQQINMLQMTPARIQLLMSGNKFEDSIKSMKEIMVGGEPFPRSLLLNLKKISNGKIYNMYGPTETTIWSTIKELNINDKIVIGKPIANIQIYILDKYLKPVPIGITGELCISGDGLARGYLNRPELTREKFIKPPFVPGKKIYKTGDLARWLTDGNIEFLGRIDTQIKIRGFRIEPGEIEQILLKQDGIIDAVVVAYDDTKGQKYLCTYIVSDKEININELKKQLSKDLPDSMLPYFFIKIDKIPLTSNGKIDRRALPLPEFKDMTVDYVSPQDDIQRKLVEIWKEVLGIEKPGIYDNFFNLGGHSLKAIIIMAKIQKIFNVEVPVKEIFGFPTIKELSKIIVKSKKKDYPELRVLEEREYYPLSSAQKRLFALEKLDNTGTAYNIPIVLIIEGELDIERLYNVFQSLIERHEAFRTYFDMLDDEPVQKIHKNFRLNINYSEKKESDLEDIISKFITPFDLKKLPLFRFKLIRLSEEKHLFLMDIHHIIFDGTSNRIFLKELFLLYEGKELQPLNFQFKDFSVWQDKLLKSEFIRKQEEFWINKFSDGIPVLELPADYPRPIVQDFSGETLIFFIEKELRDDLKKLALNTGSTLYMVLVSALHILLAKYSSQEDIVTGVPVAGRVIEEIKGVTGMFVNTLPLRNHPEGNKTFRIFLEEVRKNLLQVYDNQDYQIEMLIDKLKIKRNPSRNPLFDVIFVLQNMESLKFSIEKLNIEKHFYHDKTSKFDISFMAEETQSGIEFRLEYRKGLFRHDTISRMAGHFKNILKKISSDGDQKIGTIEILTDEEKKQLIYDFNRTDMVYQENRLIVELFEEQVEKISHKIAVIYKDNKLTYEELNKKSNQLAGILRNNGVKPDEPVAIMAERSIEMIIGIMGILKSGGCYVPVDPVYPVERIKFILQETGSSIILSQKGLYDKTSFKGTIIDLNEYENYEYSNPDIINNRDHMAYIIYTSGSTGSPHGVMIEHRSLTNFCLWYKNARNLTEKDNIACLSSFSFDASIMEIFPPLITGSTVHIIDNDTGLSIYSLNDYFEKNNITGCFFTTQIAEQFMDMVGNNSLRWLEAGGEKLRIYRKKNYTVINGYGPTECTVYTTNFILDRDYDNIPIGKPVAKSQIFIVDKFNNLLPVGIPGELCVSGDCLARGYLNRKSLTEEKFIKNPFISGERMYKTGDLARWLPDGNIEFVGRMDKQIKIRGFRIEPAEIEQIILKHDGIKEVAVIDYNDTDGHKYICAYIVSDKEINIKIFKKDLSEELPDYMIPQYIVQIEKIHLTPNGKIDRRALPLPEFKDMTLNYLSPEDETQRKLAEIWEEVTGIRSIGIRDNFFELGGNSIMAVKLFARIRKIFNRDLPVSILFKGATIEYIASVLREKEQSCLWKSLVAIQDKGSKPPFYCVTPVGDESIFFSNLVKYLGHEQPFYSLQIKLEEFTSIEALASDYIKEIQSLQPEGPYFLGGFSSGGIIAFEMAQQLHKKGYKVASLIMFDRGVHMDWTQEIIIKSICYFPYWLSNFSKNSFKVKYESICREIKRLKIMLFSLFGLHKKPFNIKDLVDLEQVIRDYSPQSYHGSIILFSSYKKSLISASSYYHDMGWGNIVTGGVEVKVIPEASHTEMFKEPYVKILAEELKECLEKAQNNEFSKNDRDF